MTKPVYKLIILDRDGVINEDSDAYIKSPEEWHKIPGSIESIALLNKNGYFVVVITNQSGIGRGYFTLGILEQIHAKMLAVLAEKNGHLDAIFFCPHHPDDECDCRKPKTKLLQEALEKFHISTQQTLVIGDSISDINLAKNAKCSAFLVKTGKGSRTIAKHPEILTDIPIFNNLAEAVEFLLT